MTKIEPDQSQNVTIQQVSNGQLASDGAGVKLVRLIGTSDLEMVDPLLLLDMFGTDKQEDYIAGFPAHPHRGFETVTYMLAGRMRHKDNAGHEGVIKTGGVQWMSAGRGIIHSEMPEQNGGLMQGFQLWLNLPAAEKMKPPRYQEFSAKQIPTENNNDGAIIKVIAGRTDSGTLGPVKNTATNPLYLDVSLEEGASFLQHIPGGHGSIVYVISGAVKLGQTENALKSGQLAVLGEGQQMAATAITANTRFLLISAKKLSEPVARGGPFVMNTQQEVLQAFQDYRDGKF